ncbi:peroxiredoxin TSA1 [Suhomyces tanzawaensis NRRL Y-17324]|uniref:thioredoxin-dependent peroxiredoxin n=1 Tax=Suhomyces tanzawaensis NRRL Y-17324 TaxID=984487 RepID=A0A1E4SIG0_9ASCO|nr:peroxiredoxin TSA1 [Suhomyces tanzawaensis NRRL Y-17324]ODV79285.1 peroxiredoxin TSA1 [Suhomyces tanzawaensis NRRL Y-17324]
MVAQIQKPAPTFKKTAVVDGVFEEVSLEQFKGQWVVLAFIPLAFTFVCPTEIIAYSEAAKKFAEKGAKVLFASTDSEYSLLAWTNVARKDGGLGPVDIPLLADTNHSLSRDYGVLLEDEGIALRGIFLIDPKGTLRQITVNDLPVGRSVEESLRLLDAFQFTEKYGEVCPANWQPGSETIKPTVGDSKEYFGKVNK